ncbi:MAG: ACT domain-containing protein [Candidatus Edwardsbacteria bacterium]|jgi:aspartate kinase|nr:ACT domain-containing protein [Candidatus Edwardsbacteria bacterium]
MGNYDISHNQMMAKVTLKSVPDKPGIAAEVFSVLAEHGIAVELLTTSHTGRTTGDISFAVPQDQVEAVKARLEGVRKEVGFKSIDSDPGVSVVTVHGQGLSQDPAAASRILKALAGGGINLQMISQSLNYLSFLVNRSQLSRGLDVLKDL